MDALPDEWEALPHAEAEKVEEITRLTVLRFLALHSPLWTALPSRLLVACISCGIQAAGYVLLCSACHHSLTKAVEGSLTWLFGLVTLVTVPRLFSGSREPWRCGACHNPAGWESPHSAEECHREVWVSASVCPGAGGP